MNDIQKKDVLSNFFPSRRFDADFPVANWLVGLWLYLKSFLYVCYFYGLGLEPYSVFNSQPWMWLEVFYFGGLCLPILYLAYALWNEKKWARGVAFFFLIIDTPLMYAHVMRLASDGYLESGLTVVLEKGGLALNLLCIAVLLTFSFGGKDSAKG